MEELKPGQEIGKARISDEDMVKWINTLKEAGFSESELDDMMSNLNFEYGRQKMSKEAQQVLSETLDYWERDLRRGKLTPTEKEYLKKHILQAEREARAKQQKEPQGEKV